MWYTWQNLKLPIITLFACRLKEELIRELVKTGKESEAMNKKYSEKIKRLEKVRARKKIYE